MKIRAIRVNRFFFFHPHFFLHTPRMGQAVAAILVFAGASFFFAFAETAVFSLGKWQVAQLAGKNPRAGKVVAQLLEQPQDLLATPAGRLRAQPEKFKLRKTLQPSFCPHAQPVSAKAAQPEHHSGFPAAPLNSWFRRN